MEFNARVLYEALRPDVPLLERLKFLCIVSSNFDEFFMVRVASIKYQIRTGDHLVCPSGLSPSAQLSAIGERVRERPMHFVRDRPVLRLLLQERNGHRVLSAPP